MKRDSVLFYRSFAEAIKKLPENNQLDAFWAIVNYGLDGEVAEDGVAAAILTAFRAVIDKNNRKFENRLNKTKKIKEEKTGTNENKQEQTETNEGEKGERRKEKGDIYNTIPDGIVSAEPTPYSQIVDMYHKCCTTLPKVKALSKTRQASIRSLYKKYGMDGFEEAGASDFLSGRTGKWNGCGFDWLIKPSNFLKVLEGNYDNGKGRAAMKVVPPERDYDMDALEIKLRASN